MNIQAETPVGIIAEKVAKEKTTKEKPEKEKQPNRVNEWFRCFAHKTSAIVGSPWAFATSVAALVIWALFGPSSGFSDTWQLVINTATTIITFLMVFLIQNTQNRDAKAIHLKLDELIHAVKGARNHLINLENLSEDELAEIEKRFKKISKLSQEKSAVKTPDKTS
jgi:low affinity Fe/Cu permease